MKSKNKRNFLDNLKVGQKVRILKLNEKNKTLKKHLLDMGFIQGTIIEIKKILPLGDPIIIKIRDYELGISKDILKRIDMEVIR